MRLPGLFLVVRPALGVLVFMLGAMLYAQGNSNVYITRFWHNHQPIYWPEWNSGVGQDLRVQYAHDSMRLKPNQNYGAPWNHPHNDLEQIFGLNDRIAAYQDRPRNALTQIGNEGGFGMSYSGSLIDNIRNLAANNWAYGSGWNWGNTEARGWTTSAGGPRLDMVGFSYHHSLNPLLPKAVLRKEIQIFKEAWWKAWGGNPDKSDHSRGYFPTEMAYSRDIIDVLVDEGYEWVIVASHHISRTSPSYNLFVNPGSFQIKSSPPNRADQLGPVIDNADQWWFAEPNPGQAAWNVAPYAYQLHRVKYIDPATGVEKFMIAVPSDDVLSYQAGYSGAQIGIVASEIAPHAHDANRPVLVMPSTDGDNAWGGGYDSWEVSTPGFFGAAQGHGYRITTMQDFVNQFGQYAPVSHIEEGAWIYPEMCYGSPYFLKWIEPPVAQPGSPTRYPDTVIDVENGWSLKFFAYAPKMAGANWVETAEQIWRDQGGDVQAWKIQAPYDWDGTWTSPNVVELAWHIYLKGLDSGFQYYGGLGNDDEVKPGLAARRAIETLQGFMAANLEEDRTGPTILKPQRFPYNPGGYTFGWFNSVPGGNTSYLKQMPSEFYIWSLVHDVSGVESVDLMIRRDKDGVRSLSNNHNETYAGGSDVEAWVRIPMTRRVLPNSRTELNALANHGQIDFVVTSPEIADHYYVKIDDTLLPGFRDNLFDYYIEAVDSRGNITRTDIQHVYVEDDGEEGTPPVTDPPGTPGGLSATALSPTSVLVSWNSTPGASGYRLYRNGVEVLETTGTSHTDTGLAPGSTVIYTLEAFNTHGVSDLSSEAGTSTPLTSQTFELGASGEPLGYLLDSPGMRIFAAIRGNLLFVATWTPTGGLNDHFILITDELAASASVPAPWAKAGFTAHPAGKPYLAGESESSYAGWFHGGSSAEIWRSSTPGGRLEGVINLVQVFGSIPERLYFATAAYQTFDGGLLVAQAPDGNGDGNIDPAEFLEIRTGFLRDSLGSGVPDAADPERGFQARLERETGELKLIVPMIPGRTYYLESSSNLRDWDRVEGHVYTPMAGDYHEVDVTPLALDGGTLFFRVSLEDAP